MTYGQVFKIVTGVLILVVSPPVVGAQSSSPAMEYSSVLTSLDVYHQDGRLQLEDDNAALSTVFLPDGGKVDVVISRAGSDTALHVQPMMVSAATGVFNRIESRGLHREFKFTEPGDYVATYRAGGRPITVVPFSIEFIKNNDEFDPKTHVYANGPWSEFAYLFASVNAGPDAIPQIRFWVRKKSFLPNPEADRYTVELRKNGDVIAVSEGGSSNSKKWQFMRLSLRHPDNKGGQALKLKELTDGQYGVLVKRNGETHAAYRFTVRGGKPMWHPRQASDFQPRTQYIVPRFPGILGAQGDDSAGNMFWMQRLSDSEAASIASSTAAPVATVSDDVRDRWNWLPSGIDPNRSFELTVTGVPTRNDTGIAAGEDLVAFGTGFPTGVKYIRVGDDEAREIPGGETYHSKVFGVCGHKIILVKKNQVIVFDTRNGKLSAIPESDVSLYDVRATLLTTGGFLVGTVNKATAVTDRTIIKVIDVSGDDPKVIPIKNADYLDSDVSSLSIDAKAGTIAVSSGRKKLIAAAKIAPLANQHVIDVTDYRGVGPQRIFIEDDWVVYADEDWKVRLLDLGTGAPKAITDEAFPRAGNGFFVRKGRLAVATTEQKVGSRYRFAIADLDDSPATVPGTGSAIEGTSGGLGMGGGAAIAIDKTVFIAGTPGDGIGVGEHLQMLDDENGTWRPIHGPAGKPLAASDVTTSIGLLAFKTLDDSGKTVIGHATYGQRIEYSETGSSSVAQTGSTPAMSPTASSPGPLKPLQLEQENIYGTNDELDEAYLNGLLQNEQTILQALTQALGEEKGKEQVIDSMSMSLKASKKEYLIDEWKRRSSLFPESEKPQPVPLVSSDADPRSVEAALTGQWRALRFVAAGEEMPDEARSMIRLTFADGKYVLMMGPNVETGTYQIDASRQPFGITITVGSGTDQGRIRRGSFKLLKDDQLLTVFSTNDTDRAIKFASTVENQSLLAGYEKVE